MHCTRTWTIECVCCSSEIVAVRWQVARLSVREDQIVMRLLESRSRPLFLTDFQAATWQFGCLDSWTNNLAAGRWTASVSQLQQTLDSSHTTRTAFAAVSLSIHQERTPVGSSNLVEGLNMWTRHAWKLTEVKWSRSRNVLAATTL